VRRLLPLALLVAGCSRPGERGTAGGAAESVSAADARAIPVVAIRVPGGGGSLRAYSLPDLAELPWTLPGRTVPLGGVVGMDVGGRRLVFRDTSGAVATFDLVAFRQRVVAPAGSLAALGADGSLLAVDRRGAVVESQAWGSRPWPDTLGPGVRAIFAARGARLLAVRAGRGDSLVEKTRDGGSVFAAAIPAATDRQASRDGDAVALTTDSGLVVVEDRDPLHPWFVRLGGQPCAVVFSPSGHRLYVALQARPALAVIDRYQRAEQPPIVLPGPAGSLRVDQWGRVLFARPAGPEADSGETWVVNLARSRVAGRLATEWDTDLPTVSSSGVVLDREGDAVVARDVRTLDSLGAAPGGGGDYWFVGAWAPATVTARQQARASDTGSARRAAAAPPAPERSAPPAEAAVARSAPAAAPQAAPMTEMRRLWLQVSASQSETASRALAAQLVAASHPAQVVAPRLEGDGWRVVVGPFATRDEAEAAGRSLGRPYFITERSIPAPTRP